MTNGSYYFPYVSQVTNEAQDSFAKFTFWSCVLVISTATSPLMTAIGIMGAFGAFSAISVLGGIYFYFFMKETSGLTEGEAKQVFFPEEEIKDTDEVVRTTVAELERERSTVKKLAQNGNHFCLGSNDLDSTTTGTPLLS